MSAEKIILFAVCATLAATLTLANPIQPSHIRIVDLRDAINKTVCPILVTFDENPDRVPRRIKVMKCAQEPNRWCEKQHIPRHECCQHTHANHQMECVEMRDTVLVYYKSKGTTETHEVSVGCSCMIEQSTRAPRVPDGPT